MPLSANQVPSFYDRWRKWLLSDSFAFPPSSSWTTIKSRQDHSCCGADLHIKTWEGPQTIFSQLYATTAAGPHSFEGFPSTIADALRSSQDADVQRQKPLLQKPGRASAAAFSCRMPSDVHPDEVLDALMDVDRRRRWEPHYRHYELIEEFAFSATLFHILGAGPRWLSRSYLLRRQHQILADGHAITQRSESHPAFPEEGAGLPQRAEVFFQGTRIRRLPASPDLAGSARAVGPVSVEVLSLQDTRAALPRALHHYFCAKEPGRWAHALYHDIVRHRASVAKDRGGAVVEKGAPSSPGTLQREDNEASLRREVPREREQAKDETTRGTTSHAPAAAPQDIFGREVGPLFFGLRAVSRWLRMAAGSALVWQQPATEAALMSRVESLYDVRGERSSVALLTPL
eukprot:TRINITY_DN4439_c0_g1_i2.p1 TRINITY_DN4439_c0_g1~~TRINITY_DN4439_c0_g1_i2.p1  ORF type:complete len:402 (-),score=32.55 TRINITY_DN4439_c0_g1_i2:415-1620(-)